MKEKKYKIFFINRFILADGVVHVYNLIYVDIKREALIEASFLNKKNTKMILFIILTLFFVPQAHKVFFYP